MSTQTMERPLLLEAPQSAPRGNVVTLPMQAEPKAYPPKLVKALMAITREFGAIAKAANKDDTSGGWNTFHNYGYQKWDDVLQRESELLVKHGIIIQQSETARSLLEKLISITYEFTIINEDGDVWPDRPVWTAIGRLIDNKGIFDDKAANKCHTQAHKYFLLHTFKIKTKETAEDEADAADSTNETTATTGTPKPPKPGSAEAQKMEGPRLLDPKGHTEVTWANGFIAAIENATAPELDQWEALNKPVFERIKGYKEPHDAVQKAIAVRRAKLAPAETATPKPPKPPAPAQVAKPMPDAANEPALWLGWLTAKLEAITTIEEGETFWAERVEALDLPDAVQEEAMGCWRQFEKRFEP